jgi:antitoxin MazE
MGNSTGMILPKAVLQEIGATVGTPMNLRVEAGEVIATPLNHARMGWEEAAIAVAAAEDDPDEVAWTAFGNDGDGELTW